MEVETETLEVQEPEVYLPDNTENKIKIEGDGDEDELELDVAITVEELISGVVKSLGTLTLDRSGGEPILEKLSKTDMRVDVDTDDDDDDSKVDKVESPVPKKKRFVRRKPMLLKKPIVILPEENEDNEDSEDNENDKVDDKELSIADIKVERNSSDDDGESSDPKAKNTNKHKHLERRKRGRPFRRESKQDDDEKETEKVDIKKEEVDDDDAESSDPKPKSKPVVRKRGRPIRRLSKQPEDDIDEIKMQEDYDDESESSGPKTKKTIQRTPGVRKRGRPIRRQSKQEDDDLDEIKMQEDYDDDDERYVTKTKKTLQHKFGAPKRGRPFRRQSKQEEEENETKIKKEKDDDDEIESSGPKAKKNIPKKPIVLKRGRPFRRQSKRIRKPIGGNKESLDISTEIPNEDDENPYAIGYQKPELLQVSKEMHNGVIFRIGDIISMTGEDGKTYYAQLKYFLSNQFCEKFVTIRWLLPNSPLCLSNDDPDCGGEKFNPDLFCQGPDQLEPINMDHIQFVMHLPEIYTCEKNIQFHQEEHGLTHMSLPTMGQGHLTLCQLSTKTGTSV